MDKTLFFKWTVSRGRDTYGYNVCTLYVDGDKISRCNGGGYDMEGTCLGDYIAVAFKDKLLKLKLKEKLYGLTFHNPDWKPSDEIVQNEKEGKDLGLERYQAFYSASTFRPSKKHNIPLIDGACGKNSVEKIMATIGLKLKYVNSTKNDTTYLINNGKK